MLNVYEKKETRNRLGKISPTFHPEEFACQHCGENGISELLLDKLQLLRTELDFPFKITSGYRCKDHPIEKKKS